MDDSTFCSNLKELLRVLIRTQWHSLFSVSVWMQLLQMFRPVTGRWPQGWSYLCMYRFLENRLRSWGLFMYLQRHVIKRQQFMWYSGCHDQLILLNFEQITTMYTHTYIHVYVCTYIDAFTHIHAGPIQYNSRPYLMSRRPRSSFRHIFRF